MGRSDAPRQSSCDAERVFGLDGFSHNVPWFLPGTILAIAVGFGLRRRVGRLVGASDVVGWALVVAVGLIAAATLTPLREGVGERNPFITGCDFSRIGFASVRTILRFDDPARNIILFAPLGFVLAFVPSWRTRTVLVAAAAVLPIAIETTQLVVTPLNRACQSADVFDNVTGLVAGLVVGLVAGALANAGTGGPTDDERP